MNPENASTVYGTWVNYSGDALTPEATLEDALINAEAEWRERLDETGAFEAMADAYRDAINNALPEGVNLVGEQFYGPFEPATSTEGTESFESITEALDSIDLQKIIDDHDTDR